MESCIRCGKELLLGYEQVVVCKGCASKVAESVPSAPTNSDYVTVLRVLDEYYECEGNKLPRLPFWDWLDTRLHSSTNVT